MEEKQCFVIFQKKTLLKIFKSFFGWRRFFMIEYWRFFFSK